MRIPEELLRIGAQVAIRQFVAPHLGRRMAGAAICLLFASLAGLGALAAGVVALGFWLAPQIGAPLAALSCSGLLLLIGIILLLIATRLTARPSPGEELQRLTKLAEKSGEELRAAAARNMPTLVAAALVGGLLLGLRGRRRER